MAEEGAGEAGVGVAGRVVEVRPGVATGYIDGGVLPDASLRAAQPSDVETVELDQVAGLLGLEMSFRAFLRLRRRRDGGAGNEAEAFEAGEMPWRFRIRQTPFAEMTMPCQRSRLSSAAIRRGPKPGKPRAKATTRSSTHGGT